MAYIPIWIAGDLECFCGDAARAADTGAASHIDNLLRDVGAHVWSELRRGKAWLRSNIAIRASDPCAPFGEIFKNNRNLFNLTEPKLAPMASFLSTLS